jgi:hypothetical protein
VRLLHRGLDGAGAHAPHAVDGHARVLAHGRYEPAWPVFIIEDHPDALTFIVAIDDQVGAPTAWKVNDAAALMRHLPTPP